MISRIVNLVVSQIQWRVASVVSSYIFRALALLAGIAIGFVVKFVVGHFGGFS